VVRLANFNNKSDYIIFEAIMPKLIECAEQVIKEDAYLLRYDINERAISHRLAMYLTPQFKDFDVDCEYNGNIDADKGRKYIYILNARAKELGLLRIPVKASSRPEVFAATVPL
jgi:hypothetical protein